MGEGTSQQAVRRHLLAVVFTGDWPTDADALADFGGQLVGHRGPGVLATFDSCHNAMLAMARASEVVPFSAGLAFATAALELATAHGFSSEVAALVALQQW